MSMRFVPVMLLAATLMGAEPPPPAAKPSAVRSLVAGAQLPEQPVTTAAGSALPLREAVGDGRVVLVVYRGGWCPICTRHFAAIGRQRADLEQRGWRLVALSPDAPESIAAWETEHDADGITRLSDSDADAIRALGLAFVVDEATRKAYAEYGIDLVAASGGQEHHILPVPAVYLVVDGEIRAVHADADYRRRLSPELLSAMVAAIGGAAD